MEPQQQSRWRPTRRQLLWGLGIAAILSVAVLIGYRYSKIDSSWIHRWLAMMVPGMSGMRSALWTEEDAEPKGGATV